LRSKYYYTCHIICSLCLKIFRETRSAFFFSQNLLQFQVPNDPIYNKYRVFIRLRHTQSKDYDPSAVALNDNECWTYHAEPTSVQDSQFNFILFRTFDYVFFIIVTVFDMINNAPVRNNDYS
jgi:hypothetical protein